MRRFISPSRRRSRFAVAGGSLIALVAIVAMLTFAGSSAASSPTTVSLGTAGGFAVLASSAVTDIPTSAIAGDVGLSPTTGAAITGLTCAEVTGTIYAVDAASPQTCAVADPNLLTNATNDLGTAYTDAAGRTPDQNLGAGDNQLNTTLAPGVYVVGHAPTANLSGTLTLNGGANAVWIFQATSDLVFANASRVVFTGGAQACNVFWQVGSSATLGTTSSVAGTILAHTSIVIQHGASLAGRALAETGDVTLDANSIQRPTCASSGGSSSGGSSGGSSSPPAPGPPDRAIYCSPSGQSYDLVKGQDKDPPYAALNLVPATIDPVTGSASCSPSVVVTTTTTTTTTVPPPPPTPAPTVTPAPKPVRKAKAAAKAAKVVRIKHVAPKPAQHQSGFTG